MTKSPFPPTTWFFSLCIKWFWLVGTLFGGYTCLHCLLVSTLLSYQSWLQRLPLLTVHGGFLNLMRNRFCLSVLISPPNKEKTKARVDTTRQYLYIAYFWILKRKVRFWSNNGFMIMISYYVDIFSDFLENNVG